MPEAVILNELKINMHLHGAEKYTPRVSNVRCPGRRLSAASSSVWPNKIKAFFHLSSINDSIWHTSSHGKGIGEVKIRGWPSIILRMVSAWSQQGWLANERSLESRSLWKIHAFHPRVAANPCSSVGMYCLPCIASILCVLIPISPIFDRRVEMRRPRPQPCFCFCSRYANKF